MTRARFAGIILAGLAISSLPVRCMAFNIYMKNASGGVDMVASSIGTIARRGSTFSSSEFRYKMTSLLFTYPDYPELGYNTPENESVARAEAERLNRQIDDLHARGIKALVHTYEIEVPKGFIPKHPELECSGAGLRVDGNKITWFIPDEKSGGMCLYKPGAREFIQRRFDELFRRLPDLDGIIFSLNESAVRPYRGTCSACADKDLEDKVRDMIQILDESVTRAMHKVRPGKDPYNVARTWGVPEYVARRDPQKVRQLVRAFLGAPDDVPIVIKVGYGDYNIFMDTAPAAVALARANSQPFLLDVGRRGVEPFAPGIFGQQNQLFFQDTACSSLAGVFYSRGRPESEDHPLKIGTLNWDTMVRLLQNPSADLMEFYSEWAGRELRLDAAAASSTSQILRNWEDVCVLGATQNGCDWEFAGGLDGCSSIDGLVRPGSRWTWNYNLFDKIGGFYGERANIYEASTDSLGTAREKYDRIIAEKRDALRLARQNVQTLAKLEGKLEDKRFQDLRVLLRQCEWWCRSREALARAFWLWWFDPRVEPKRVSKAYQEYLHILREPVGATQRDAFMTEREALEVTVARLGWPGAEGIYSFGVNELVPDGAFARELPSDVERGDPLRFWIPTTGRGSLRAEFRGSAGRYEVAVKFRNSVEGSGNLRLLVAGRIVDEWTVDRAEFPSDYWRFVDLDLSGGEDLQIDADSSGGSCRVYRIHVCRIK